jgi:CRP/FNR family transcriptional regulator, dissimilatory nitrate respiration regulator
VDVKIRQWLPPAVQAAGTERTLASGQSLFRSGGETLGLFEVVQGKVRLVRTDPSGRETVLQSATPGDFISEASLFSPVYHCDAIASGESVVRLYPKAAILAALSEPDAAREFMAILAREIMRLRARLQISNIHSGRERVRHYLIANAGVDGQMPLRGSLKELASELGLTHEALYRTLAAMERDGEIERAKSAITLLRHTV